MRGEVRMVDRMRLAVELRGEDGRVLDRCGGGGGW